MKEISFFSYFYLRKDAFSVIQYTIQQKKYPLLVRTVEMLPRIERIKKKENYPQDRNQQNTNTILKLKLIRQFLEKEHSDSFGHTKPFITRKLRHNQNLKQTKNSIRLRSPLAEINSPKSMSKFLNINISKSGRNLRLSQLYDIDKKQCFMSEQLKRSFTNSKVR